MAQHYPNLSAYLLIFNNEIKESMTSLFCSTRLSDVPIRRIQSSDKYFRMQHMIHESIISSEDEEEDEEEENPSDFTRKYLLRSNDTKL